MGLELEGASIVRSGWLAFQETKSNLGEQNEC